MFILPTMLTYIQRDALTLGISLTAPVLAGFPKPISVILSTLVTDCIPMTLDSGFYLHSIYLYFLNNLMR